MSETALTKRIEEIVAPSLEAKGFEIVRVRLTGGQAPTLQIMADRIDGVPINVDDCAAISRHVSVLLDAKDPIKSAYTLEISSPGIDRPLVRPKDFERFAGFEAKLETKMPIDGRRRFRGRLGGLEDDAVCLTLEDGEVRIPFGDIDRAKLLLTDELLAAAAAQENQPRN